MAQPKGPRTMNLFDPSRPEASPNHPAILIDGSAMPHFVLHVEPNNMVTLQVMLRNSDDNSYSYRTCEVPQEALGDLMALFRANPEEFFAEWFNWRPVAKVVPLARRPIVEPFPMEQLL